MGQKTHPLGFRLNITQNHKSSWFIPLNKYSTLLEEDYKIRTYFSSKVFLSLVSKYNTEKSNNINKKATILKTVNISNIKINRSTVNNNANIYLYDICTQRDPQGIESVRPLDESLVSKFHSLINIAETIDDIYSLNSSWRTYRTQYLFFILWWM